MHIVLPCTRKVHVVGTCPCCCDERRLGWQCPLEPCTYSMCPSCHAQERDRQGNGVGFQCPMCRRSVVLVKVLPAPRSRLSYRMPITIQDTLVQQPRRVLVRSKTYCSTTCKPLAQSVVSYVAFGTIMVVGYTFAITFVLVVGRIVYKMFHLDDHYPMFPQCDTPMCFVLLILSSVLGLIYTFALCVCAFCVKVCWNLPVE